MLQSGTVQDGGSGDNRSRWTRIFHYDILDVANPALVGEWDECQVAKFLASPVARQGRAVSELYYLS